jgi:hypothetical protein
MRFEPVLSEKIGDATAGEADLPTEQPRGLSSGIWAEGPVLNFDRAV